MKLKTIFHFLIIISFMSIFTFEILAKGEPRVQYERTYWVLHDNPANPITETQVREVAGMAYDENKRTLGYSFDDAGIGDLDARNVVIWGLPQNQIQVYVDWYKDWYGGVTLWFKSLPNQQPSYERGPIYTTAPSSGRGEPRIDYTREYWVMDGEVSGGYPVSRTHYVDTAVEAFHNSRQTIGCSFDDAGIGSLTYRKVVVKWIGQYTEQGLIDFYNTYYPEVDLHFDSSPPSPEPDVYIQDLWWSPANPSPGDNVKFNVRVHNNGSVSTGDIVGVGYFINGQYYSYGYTGIMDANETSEDFLMMQNWTAPAGGGDFTIKAWVDDINRFEESDETNNTREEVLRIDSSLPTDQELFGLHINANYSEQNPPRNELSELGVKWVRSIQYTTSFIPEQRNVKWLVVFNQEAIPQIDGESWNEYVDRFSDEVTQRVRDNSDWISAIQIFNEVDLEHMDNLTAEQYAPMLKATYQKVKTLANPPIVVFSGLASGAGNGADYLEAVKDIWNGGIYFDKAALHPYQAEIDGIGWPEHGNMENSINHFYEFTEGRSIWLTEFGLAIDQIDEDNIDEKKRKQAEYIRKCYNLFQRLKDGSKRKVEVAFWFTWDDRTLGVNPSVRYGLVEQDRSGEPSTWRRPAWYSYKSVATGAVCLVPENISENMSTQSATIEWTTDISSTSNVYYKKKDSRSWNNTGNNILLTNHSIALSNLSPNTTYEYFVKSTREGYTDGQSSIREIRTKALNLGVLHGFVYEENNAFIQSKESYNRINHPGYQDASETKSSPTRVAPGPWVPYPRQPLSGATVTIAGRTGKSNSKGYYYIDKIPAGVHTATCSHPVKNPLNKKLTIAAGGTTYHNWIFPAGLILKK